MCNRVVAASIIHLLKFHLTDSTTTTLCGTLECGSLNKMADASDISVASRCLSFNDLLVKSANG